MPYEPGGAHASRGRLTMACGGLDLRVVVPSRSHMPRLSAAEVFTPTSYPTYTYVPRDELHHERLLRQWTRSSTQIASISGPSKAGKTVLVQRVVGEGNLVTVSGASVRAPDQLWERVLDWWGEPHVTVASRADSSSEGSSRDRSANVGLAGTGATAKSGTATTTVSAETLQATVNRRGLPAGGAGDGELSVHDPAR